MSTNRIDGIERELTADEIQWDLTPLPDVPADPDPFTAALVDALAYRSLVQAALDQLREVTLELDRERERYLRLLDDYRELRSELRELKNQTAC
jgi:hypothetical protein